MTLKLIPASNYTIQELTDLYNKTRVDYLVPMPMSVERLQNYIDDFDVDLRHSCVACAPDGEVVGLGMLGVRDSLAWITRLGVLPVTRRSGAGEAMMDFMLGEADSSGMEETHLEVISNNDPAHKLFLKKGFRDVDLYLVLRRAPHPISEPTYGDVEWLEKDEALRLLESYPQHLTWITAYQSMQNAPDTKGMHIQLPSGDMGWLVFRLQKFYVTHLIMYTEKGNEVEVGIQLLRNLYTRYPRIDTYAENIHEKDPHLSAFQALSFFENFSRVEMRRKIFNNPEN
jgi:ribosomal protein S18 acetylase RimI-like enzyme